MFALLVILFIVECGAFCYLFCKILNLEKDVEVLFDNYAKELEKVTKLNIKLNKRGCVR